MGPQKHNDFAEKQLRDAKMKRVVVSMHQPAGTIGPRVRPAEFLNDDHLTPSVKREIRRRDGILTKFEGLLAGGMSQAQAAKKMRQSLVTLWRWRKCVVPACIPGRTPAFSLANVPESIIKRVQRLQVGGMGNANAWRAVANEKACPEMLRKFLKSARTIPASFLKASRLNRQTVTLIKGRGFSVLQPHE